MVINEALIEGKMKCLGDLTDPKRRTKQPYVNTSD